MSKKKGGGNFGKMAFAETKVSVMGWGKEIPPRHVSRVGNRCNGRKVKQIRLIRYDI